MATNRVFKKENHYKDALKNEDPWCGGQARFISAIRKQRREELSLSAKPSLVYTAPPQSELQRDPVSTRYSFTLVTATNRGSRTLNIQSS